MPMQPSPIAETRGPVNPSCRVINRKPSSVPRVPGKPTNGYQLPPLAPDTHDVVDTTTRSRRPVGAGDHQADLRAPEVQCPHWNEVELIFLSYNSIMRKAAHRSIPLVLTDVPDDALS